MKIFSFTEAPGEPLSQTIGNGPTWAAFTQQTVQRNISEWKDYVAANFTLYVPDETLLVVNIFGNPGHCLNDLVFSIALDAWQRKLYTDSPAYPHFVSSWFTTLSAGFDEESWCMQFLQTTGIIDRNSALKQIAPITCFESLLVPYIGVHRFPIDWSDTNTINSLQRRHWNEHFSYQTFPSLENNVMKPNMYPVQALRALQERLWKGLQLESPPLQPPRHNDDDSNDTFIFLYNRQGHRRFWNQSYEFAAVLQRDYKAQVQVVGEQWDRYTFQDQMKAYNNQSHIIVVHGAHESNLMASRPQTKVIELMPFAVDPMPSKATKNDSLNDSDTQYYGQSGWFASFTRRLDVEHFTWGDDSTGGRKSFESSEIHFHLPRLLEFVVDRFELIPRSSIATR
jgi:hypothetical protein